MSAKVGKKSGFYAENSREPERKWSKNHHFLSNVLKSSVVDPDPVFLGHPDPDPEKTGFESGSEAEVHKQTLVSLYKMV